MSMIVCFWITCGAASVVAQLGLSSCQVVSRGGSSNGQRYLGLLHCLQGKEVILSQESLDIY